MTQANLWRAAWMAATVALAPGAAMADDPVDAPLRIEASPTFSFARQPGAGQPPAAPPRSVPRFGDEDSRWWTIGGGISLASDATDLNLPRIAFSQFLAEDVEWSVELNAWYFDQKGADQLGINPATVFRWHFVNTGPWTVYADAGIGVLYVTGDVPPGGTRLDFTPKVGIGFTRQISDSGARLQVGLRWHHISNARIQDDARNPARDAPMLYLGIEFPF